MLWVWRNKHFNGDVIFGVQRPGVIFIHLVIYFTTTLLNSTTYRCSSLNCNMSILGLEAWCHHDGLVTCTVIWGTLSRLLILEAIPWELWASLVIRLQTPIKQECRFFLLLQVYHSQNEMFIAFLKLSNNTTEIWPRALLVEVMLWSWA